MKKLILPLGWLGFLCLLSSCRNEIPTAITPSQTDVVPIDIQSQGFEFLDHMQGHWVGRNQVMTFDYDWFAFDYRPISPSHIFGIHEGGSMGNLLTSFFIADFQGTRTLMARNGGVLNGIYRTTYFVLDEVQNGAEEDSYRFVDAVAGSAIMFMELSFKGDSLRFDAYTSGIGQRETPTRHMSFQGRRADRSLSDAAANQVGFPEDEIAHDFSAGFNRDYLTALPGSSRGLSATFLAQQATNDVFQLGPASGDPFTIQAHPFLATLHVDLSRNQQIQDKPLFLYLSGQSLTDINGLFIESAFESLYHFPELSTGEEGFLFTYLHPGTYFVTVVADMNGDGYPSTGDLTSLSQAITVAPESQSQVSISNITYQN